MLRDMVRSADRRAPPGHNLVGAGVAAAGLVRREDGFLSVSPNRGWRDAPLGEMISQSLGIARVSVANEADAARSQSPGAAPPAARNVLFITGEVGLGLGVIQDGRPMLGAAGYAGEAGHMVINPQGRPCGCGSTGCWETEVGEEAFARAAGIPWGHVRQDLIDELLRRAHGGDPQVFEAFRDVGRWLGIGVGNLINVFNPDLIVFGGFYHPMFPFLEQSVVEAARRVALCGPVELLSHQPQRARPRRPARRRRRDGVRRGDRRAVPLRRRRSGGVTESSGHRGSAKPSR